MRDAPRVLIIDDDPEIVQAIAIRLGAAGYDVITAHDAEQGIDLALETRPDVVVMDIQMPTMDGLTALALIHAHSATQNTPVVVLSACSSARRHALQMGARYFLDKPFNVKALLEAIEGSMAEEAVGVE